jgi:class 3 adenylate cyclase
MTLKKDIIDKVKSIVDTDFTTDNVTYVPRIDNSKLTFGNSGLKFEATTLFIDMRGSTKVLNKHNKTTVAKIHMSYFHAIVKIANANNGHVRSFNGDSALVFFQGTTKDALSNAVITAMKIKFMLSDSDDGINTMLKKYSEIDFGIGIDDGEILCTKVGVGGEHNRDLFWIGNCVNKSTKIGDKCNAPNNIGISNHVYSNLNDNAKYGSDGKTNIWTQGTFEYNGIFECYYYSNWHCTVN